MTDIPLPATGSTNWTGWAAEQEDLSDDVRNLGTVNVKDYGAAIDGTTDDAAAIRSAITALGGRGGVALFPPGITIAGSTITVPSNVRLVGAGKNASIVKKVFNGVLFDFSGTSTSSRCQRSGAADLQLNGGQNTTGALIQANYADHLNFDRVWCYQNNDSAVVATELWDSYFVGCEFEWCGLSTWKTGAVVRLLGSATDSTNEIYFSQCRWESFPGHALFIDSNGGTHAPYGIWLSQCKMESAQINGASAFIDSTNDVADIHIRDLYAAADGLGTGGAAVYALINVVAAVNFTIQGVHAWVNGSSVASVIRLFPGAVGHSIIDVYVDAPTAPSSGIVQFAGGTPSMRIRNVRYKSGQTGAVYSGTVPAGVVLEDMETTGTGPPASGAWLVGAKVWNSAPAASTTPGWVCVTAGAPGTWKAMPNLAA